MSTSSVPSTKRCAKCGEEKPATNESYHKQAASADGLRRVCKICRKTETHLRYEAKRDHINKTNIEWRKANPEKVKGYRQDYVKRNPERVARSKKDYESAHAEEIYVKTKQYRADNPEIYQAHLAVTCAVMSGRLPKVGTQKCEQCANRARHYHHWSYKPEHHLDVVPLCTKCHRAIHSK